MSQDYKYFVIPFDQVPAAPAYTVWYAAWATTRPALEPGASAPLVVGVTAGDLPKGATLLGAGLKDPTPTPPPPPPPPDTNLSGYQSSVQAWLALGRDG